MSDQRPPGTFKVGTVAGSDVLVSTSWFLVAALIAIIMAPLVEQVQPGLGALKYVAGLAFAVLLYGSVLLHEASHAIVAKRLGYPVSSITLHFLGGMTSIEGEAKRPREEFFIAVVGPLTSIAVGVAALLLLPVTPDGLTRLAMEGLAGANLLVGVLNVDTAAGAIVALLAVVLLVVITFFSGVLLRAGERGVSFSLVPFWGRRLRWENLARVDVEEVRPFEDFGGWGIKGSQRRHGILLSAGETRTVRFTTTDGRRYLLGLGDETEAAVRALQQAAPVGTGVIFAG